MTRAEKIDALEEAIEELESVCRTLKGLRDEGIRRRVIGHIEGRDGGWLGEGLIDILRDEIRDLEEQEAEAAHGAVEMVLDAENLASEQIETVARELAAGVDASAPREED